MGSGFSGMLNHLTFGLFKNSAPEIRGDTTKSQASGEGLTAPT